MEKRILKYVKDNKMIESGDKIVVGVSGGADSVCLFYMLLFISKYIPIEICVAHIEHGIRGQDSINDAKYVEKIAKEHNVNFKLFSYDVIGEGKKLGLGTEEAGRILRYKSFDMAAREFFNNGKYKIAVAHNKNDSVETVLHNLFRGTGLKGVAGISGKRDNIIRPLIEVERVEIEEWLERKKIEYRTDATNFETDYTRNKIRLKILPQIQSEINKQVVNNIRAFSEYAKEANNYIESQVNVAFDKYVIVLDKKIIILRECKDENIVILKGVVRQAIAQIANGLKDISRKHIEDTISLFDRQTGKEVHLLGKIVAKRIYEGISIESMETQSFSDNIVEKIIVNNSGEYRFNDYIFTISIEKWEKNQLIPEKMYTKWFDYDRIKGVLQIRNRQSQDYIQINKEGQKKKLKSYFIDNKIPQQMRQHIPLLTDDNHIIWIVGHRISEEYKVTDNTRIVMKVQVNGGNENG